MANLKSGTLIGGNMIWNAGNMPLTYASGNLKIDNYKIYTENQKPTPAELGAVNKAGDTMTGVLNVPRIQITVGNAGITNDAGDNLIRAGGGNLHTVVGNTTGDMYLDTKDGRAYVRVGNTANRVYHEGFKPTPADIGAVNKAGDTMSGKLTATQFVSQQAASAFTTGQTGGNGYGVISAESGYVMLWRRRAGSTTHADEFIGINSGSQLQFRQDAGKGDKTYRDNLVYHTGYKPTPADINAVNKSGDTMQGNLSLHNATVYPTFPLPDKAVGTPNGLYVGMTGGTGVGEYMTYASVLGINAGADTTRHMQIMCGTEGNTFFIRNAHSNSGTASGFYPWRRIYTDANKPTPADIGAVNKTGDTMTGVLAVSNRAQFGTSADGKSFGSPSISNQMDDKIEIVTSAKSSNNPSTGIVFHNRNAATSALYFKNESASVGYFNFVSDESNWNVRVNGNPVYHTGNKPTAAEFFGIGGKQGAAADGVRYTEDGSTDFNKLLTAGEYSISGDWKNGINNTSAAQNHTCICKVEVRNWPAQCAYKQTVTVISENSTNQIIRSGTGTYPNITWTRWTRFGPYEANMQYRAIIDRPGNSPYPYMTLVKSDDRTDLTSGWYTIGAVQFKHKTKSDPNNPDSAVAASVFATDTMFDRSQNRTRFQTRNSGGAVANEMIIYEGFTDFNQGSTRCARFQNGAASVNGTLSVGNKIYHDAMTSSNKQVVNANSANQVFLGNTTVKALKLEIASDGTAVVSQSGTDRKIYHEGNKPTPNDIGAYTKSEVDNLGKLRVLDIRGAARNPDYFTSKSLTPWFNNEGMPTASWYSGITVKGWENSYNSWQLFSFSNTGSSDNKLYFRTGKDAAWNTTYEVYHSGRKPTPADIGAVNKAGDTMTGRLTINNNNPTILLQDTDNKSAFLHTNSNNFYVLRSSGNNGNTWDSGPNGRHPLTLHLDNGDATVSRNVICDSVYSRSGYIEWSQAAGSNSQFNLRNWGHSDRVAVFELSDKTSWHWYCQRMASGVIEFSVNGNGSFNDVYIRSDRRLKTNIKHIDSSIELVKKLIPVKYDKKSTSSGEFDSAETGFIAQDVEKYIPDAVATDSNGMKSLKPYAIIAHLTKALQELEARVNTLEAK